jgi:hypothetical protein
MLHFHVHAAVLCPSCMSMSMLHVQVYAISMSMLQVHIHASCPCPCCMSMSMLHFHVHGSEYFEANRSELKRVNRFLGSLCFEANILKELKRIEANIFI